MADSQSKIDAAAEKAFADAAEKKTADSAKQPVDAKAVEKAVDAGASAPVKADAVAKAYFKLLAYKDEYEVARLFAETDFMKEVNETFEGDFKVHFHLAPPLLSGETDAQGRPKKRRRGRQGGFAGQEGKAFQEDGKIGRIGVGQIQSVVSSPSTSTSRTVKVVPTPGSLSI